MAAGISYADAYALLYELQGRHRLCSTDLVTLLKLEPAKLGVMRTFDFPAKAGQPRMTGAAFCRRHRAGRYVLRLAHHVVAVKDGLVYDVFDSTEKCVYRAWEIAPVSPETP